MPGRNAGSTVIDAATGRGVPLVELRTVNKASWWTDSNGIVAFDEPGLMDIEVFFHVDTGSPLTRGLESVAWNEFRQRWIAFFADRAGEVWFAEADTPLGPWGYGRRCRWAGRPAYPPRP